MNITCKWLVEISDCFFINTQKNRLYYSGHSDLLCDAGLLIKPKFILRCSKFWSCKVLPSYVDLSHFAFAHEISNIWKWSRNSHYAICLVDVFLRGRDAFSTILIRFLQRKTFLECIVREIHQCLHMCFLSVNYGNCKRKFNTDGLRYMNCL